MKPEETFDFQIRSSWIGMSKMYNDAVASHGTTMSIAFVLLSIDVKNGSRSTALGPKMGMEATSLSRLLKNMENDGLIYREQHPEDKRSVLIKLTADGVEMRNKSKGIVLEFNEKAYQALTPKEAEAFFSTMKKLNNVVSTLRKDLAQ